MLLAFRVFPCSPVKTLLVSAARAPRRGNLYIPVNALKESALHQRAATAKTELWPQAPAVRNRSQAPKASRSCRASHLHTWDGARAHTVLWRSPSGLARLRSPLN